jgi:Helix-hairpin-helix motif
LPGSRGPSSWWIAFTLVPVGELSWASFVYAGARARRPLWIGFGGVYLVLNLGGWALTDASGEAGAALIFGSWLVSIVHVLVLRPAYVERLELFEAGAFDRAEARALEREEARRLAERDPKRAVELGIGRPSDDGFHGGVVDLNNAEVEAIEGLPGVDRELAQRIVDVRAEVHGFSSLEDLAHVLDMPAPLVDRIRNDVVVLPRGFE